MFSNKRENSNHRYSINFLCSCIGIGLYLCFVDEIQFVYCSDMVVLVLYMEKLYVSLLVCNVCFVFFLEMRNQESDNSNEYFKCCLSLHLSNYKFSWVIHH